MLMSGHKPQRSCRRTDVRGFSLIEAVISIAVMATMTVAVLGTIGSSARSRLIQADRCRAMALVRDLLAEVAQCGYADLGSGVVFGPETGETRRAGFDDVDDYSNWQESPPTSRSGLTLVGYAGWGRGVTVEWVDPENPGQVYGSETGLKRITVKVTSPRGKGVSLSALRSKYSGYDRGIRSATSFTSCVGVTLQLGPDNSAKAVSSVNLVNQSP